jgi:hypothetical protein
MNEGRVECFLRRGHKKQAQEIPPRRMGEGKQKKGLKIQIYALCTLAPPPLPFLLAQIEM